MRRLRVGIVGAGHVAERTLIPLLSAPGAAAPDNSWNRGLSVRSAPAGGTRVLSPALVALAASGVEDAATARVLAENARLPQAHSDWRAMLRETELDVVMCAASPETAAQLLVTLSSWRSVSKAPRAVWICGLPAPSSAGASQLMQMVAGRDVLVWCAQPLRHDFAHHAAMRLVERDHIGAVASLDFRSGSAFPARVLAGENHARNGALERENRDFAAAYQAFSCLLSMAGGVSISAARLTAARRGEAVGVWMQLAAGTLITARFCAADAWNAPLPRLEICGSDGRFLVCEGGRRLWQHEPRVAARMVEPPASSPRLLGAGVAEDARAFLSQVAGACGTGVGSEAERLAREHDLASSIRALRLVEASAFCLRENSFVTLERDGVLPLQNAPSKEAQAAREKTAPPLFAVPPLKPARENPEETASRREVTEVGGEYASAVSPNLTLPW